jgi:hypothetical protein
MMRHAVRLGARQAHQVRLTRPPSQVPAVWGVMSRRAYNCMNSIEDMFQASEAWHQASAFNPQSATSDESLREAFNRIDINGNGLIEPNELKAALMASGQTDIDDETVDNMIQWACTKVRRSSPPSLEHPDFYRRSVPIVRSCAPGKFGRSPTATLISRSTARSCECGSLISSRRRSERRQSDPSSVGGFAA